VVRLLSGLLTVSLVLCLACGKKPRVVVPVDTSAKTQRGLASWYGKGDSYHGKRTSSGERFDRNALTGAHYDLPFGSIVAVTNERNGKQVVVRINDRFPLETLRKGRVIDLSYQAAQHLDMVRDGVVPVTLEVLSVPETEH
jgi:rare lipoprotein A